MSNIKQVDIKGWLPMVTGDVEVLQWLGRLHTPLQGLKFRWTGQQLSLQNRSGGCTFFYEYHITGAEGYSWEGIKELVQIFNKTGPVKQCLVRDIENSSQMSDAKKDWVTSDWRAPYLDIMGD